MSRSSDRHVPPASVTVVIPARFGSSRFPGKPLVDLAGKPLIQYVYEHVQARYDRVELFDGDEIRKHLCRDLRFSKPDRDENIRRIGFVAELLTRNGVIVLVAAISPYRAARW